MHTFRIGKLAGVEIRIDASWLFIFVLLSWNLTSVFSRWHVDWSPFASLAVAVAASLLFFGCILLHELAHALAARRKGLRVRSITLFLFGGVSNIEHEPPSAGAEFLIAVVGPVTSILIGVCFWAVSSLLTGAPVANASAGSAGYASLGPFETLIAWLGPVNVAIGLFNLVPAFPLDGGRVLRSLLWAISRDFRTATRRVSAIGQLFGWLFILAGIAMTFDVHFVLFGTGLANGLWLAFIGWFLRGAASQSYRRLAIDDALAGHVVEDAMRRGGPSVTPETSLATLVQDCFVRSDERAVPVVRGDQLLGLVSMTDVRTVARADWPMTSVESVMRPRASLAVTSPHESLADALERIAEQDVGQLPVVEDGHWVGVLHRRDIARELELAWAPSAARS